MIKVRVLVLFLIMTTAISSCGKISQIEVGEVNDFKIKGFEGNALVVGVTIPVKNPSRYKIRITGFDAKIYINQNYLGRINSIDPVLIPGKSSDSYNIVFYVRMANPFGAALTVMNLQHGQKINIKIEGVITSKTTLMRKKLVINEERNVVL